MFSLLPDLAPRDPHSLWYTSSRNPLSSNNTYDAHLSSLHEQGQPPPNHSHPHGANSHRRGALLIERSPLARLRADEQNLERRRQNVTNFGSAWLKPPGLPKTLHQLREERREAEEHQEALRREQLAQELAEAEAEAAGGDGGGVGGGGGVVGGEVEAMLDAPPGGEDGMDDVQLDGARDLDDDIPEADAADFGLSADEEDEDEEDEDEDDDEDADDDDEEREMRAAHAQQQQLVAQRMRQVHGAFREDLAPSRGSAAFYGGDEDIDDEDQSQMLEEDDLIGGGHHGNVTDDMGMNMDADLDDEIPEAESMGGYEHTDTEAELSSSSVDEDYNHEHSHTRSSFAAPLQQQANRFRHSLARSDATRNSIAISDILSRDGSSVLGSSPQVPRQRGGLSARRGRG